MKQMSAQQTRLLGYLGEGVERPGKGGRQLSCTGIAAYPGNIYSDLGATRWFSPTGQSMLAFSSDTARKVKARMVILLCVPNGHTLSSLS